MAPKSKSKSLVEQFAELDDPTPKGMHFIPIFSLK